MQPPATSAIADLTERMGKITGQLKLFAGKARQRRNAVRVRAALDHVLQLMAPRLGRDATGAGSTATRGPGRMGRRTEARTGAAESGRQRARRHCRRRRRGWPRRRRRQRDGRDRHARRARQWPGIAPDALPRLFEPFFTTKEIGQGWAWGWRSRRRSCASSAAS
jgi:two-component system C4-dicarboxylate transport sensor histidine kinase DctB